MAEKRGSLKNVLEQVEFLRRDLSADPDTQKRESLKQQLQQIYDSSEWYSARYLAGRALGVRNDQPKDRLVSWISNIRQQFNAKTIVEEEKKHWEEEVHTGGSGHGDSCIRAEYYYPGGWIIDKPATTKPDKEKRREAKNDFRRFKAELKKTFKDSNVDSKERCAAGEALDYSAFRILVRVYPIETMFLGFVFLGLMAIAIGIIYLIRCLGLGLMPSLTIIGIIFVALFIIGEIIGEKISK